MKLQLIDDWKKAWKMYSVIIFAIIAVAPELYNLAISFGLVQADAVPGGFSKIISLVAFLGAASRIVKQKALESNPELAAEEKGEANPPAAP